ncbi:MAG: ABC transporter ATP-binding protein [Bacteroidales bacterium]
MSKYSVIVENISKSYKDVKAVLDLSFSVEKGDLYGLIGPDGSGKTSLFRMLTTLLIPDSGRATVEGFDVVKDYKAIRGISGYMPGRFSLYHDLTVEENLQFFATIFGTTIKENYDLIKDIYIQIEPFKNRKAGKLSGGMKQKLALSCALIHKPVILFLDEPTTGVDAVSRKEFWEMLKNLQQKGITILVSTPYMDEAGLCDHVALIQKGEMLGIDSPENIIKDFDSQLYSVRTDDMYHLPGDLMEIKGSVSAFRFGDVVHFATKEKVDTSEINLQLEAKGYQGIRVQEIVPNIEDCFMALMNNEN